MSNLPTDAKARKNVPLFRGLFRYFPDALAAVAELSRIGNEQHNPGSEMHWDRTKSGDELDSMLRHTLDAGGMDTDKVLHDTKIAWRALANLQKVLEKRMVVTANGQANPLSQYDPTRILQSMANVTGVKAK